MWSLLQRSQQRDLRHGLSGQVGLTVVVAVALDGKHACASVIRIFRVLWTVLVIGFRLESVICTIAQLMVGGLTGLTGLTAVRLVTMGRRFACAHAPILPLLMKGKTAMERELRLNHASSDIVQLTVCGWLGLIGVTVPESVMEGFRNVLGRDWMQDMEEGCALEMTQNYVLATRITAQGMVVGVHGPSGQTAV